MLAASRSPWAALLLAALLLGSGLAVVIGANEGYAVPGLAAVAPSDDAVQPAAPKAGLQAGPYFEANLGQAGPTGGFLVRGLGPVAWLQGDGLHSASSTLLSFVDGDAALAPAAPLASYSNYLRGSDPTRWMTNVPHSAEVSGRGLYDGIDVRWYVADGSLEFDLLLAPGADIDQVRLASDEGLSLVDGDLHAGAIVIPAPLAFQDLAAGRVPVESAYVLVDGEARILLGAYDAAAPLTVDPQILYSSYYGGSAADQAAEVVANGPYAYVMGTTASTDLTVQDSVDPTFQGVGDAFIARFDTTGSNSGSLVWATYLGGDGDDHGDGGIALADDGSLYFGYRCGDGTCPVLGEDGFDTNYDGGSEGMVGQISSDGTTVLWSSWIGGSGNDNLWGLAAGQQGVYVVGDTTSTNLPTVRACQPQLKTSSPAGQPDGFVMWIASDGQGLLLSTYLGGAREDRLFAVDVDDEGHIFFGGRTLGNDFPVFRSVPPSTCVPHTIGYDVDLFGSAADGIFGRIDPELPASDTVAYSSYIGGGGYDAVYGVAHDPANADWVYIAGDVGGGISPPSGAAPFSSVPSVSPNAPGSSDLFVVRVDTAQTGTSLGIRAGTYLGSSGQDTMSTNGAGILPDGLGNPLDVTRDAVFVTGRTFVTGAPSPAYPLAGTPRLQPFANSNSPEVALSVLKPDLGSFVFSSVVGGAGSGPCGDDRGAGVSYSAGAVMVVGGTTSYNNPPSCTPFPVSSVALQSVACCDLPPTGSDAFVMRVGGILPLPVPKFTWAADPSAQYNPPVIDDDPAQTLLFSTIHSGNRLTMKDATTYTGLDPMQHITTWTWTAEAYHSLAYSASMGCPVPPKLFCPPSYTSTCPVAYPSPFFQVTYFTATQQPTFIQNLDVGDVLVLTLTIADNLGGVATSAPQCLMLYENMCPGDPDPNPLAPPNLPPDFTVGPVGGGVANGQPVLFHGIAFDPDDVPYNDGIIAQWIWDFGDGSGGTGGPDIEHVYTFDGIFYARLTVVDDDGCRVATGLQQVRVSPGASTGTDPGLSGSRPVYIAPRPVADAGPDQGITEGNFVQLDGTGADGNAASVYRWSQLSGPPQNLTQQFTGKPFFRAPEVPGSTEMVFQLVINDGRLDSLPDTVTITINPGNKAPRADAGKDKLAAEGKVFQLDGSKSVDPEGRGLTYRWEQISGPAVLLTNPSRSDLKTPGFAVARPAFLVPPFSKEPELVFRLTVSDGVLTSPVDKVVISITPTSEFDFRVEQKGPNEIKFLPLDSTLGRNYEWSFGDGTRNSTQAAPTHVYDLPGSYEITVRVTHPDGYDQLSSQIIEVAGEEQVPAEAVHRRYDVDFLQSAWFIGLLAFVLILLLGCGIAYGLARKGRRKA